MYQIRAGFDQPEEKWYRETDNQDEDNDEAPVTPKKSDAQKKKSTRCWDLPVICTGFDITPETYVDVLNATERLIYQFDSFHLVSLKKKDSRWVKSQIATELKKKFTWLEDNEKLDKRSNGTFDCWKNLALYGMISWVHEQMKGKNFDPTYVKKIVYTDRPLRAFKKPNKDAQFPYRNCLIKFVYLNQRHNDTLVKIPQFCSISEKNGQANLDTIKFASLSSNLHLHIFREKSEVLTYCIAPPGAQGDLSLHTKIESAKDMKVAISSMHQTLKKDEREMTIYVMNLRDWENRENQEDEEDQGMFFSV
jgi:hypothetical protein